MSSSIRSVLSKNLTVSSRFYTTSTPTTSSFTDIHNDLSTRFLRDSLNTTNRNLVFRPRRSKELTSRKHPIIVNGDQLKPLDYKGKPGKGELFRLLSAVSTIEEYQQSKTTLQNYAKYSRESLQPLHLAHFIRAGATVGQLEDAFRTVATHKLFSKKNRKGIVIETLVSDVVHKELLRLRVIRASLSNKPSACFNQVYKAYSRLSDGGRIDGSLLLTSGLANSLKRALSIEDEKTQKVFELKLIRQLEQLKEEIDNLSIESLVEQGSDKEIGNSVKFPFVVDLTLGVESLESISNGEVTSSEKLSNLAKSIDADKIHTVISAWSKTFPKARINTYVQSVQEGYKNENEVAQSESEA